LIKSGFPKPSKFPKIKVSDRHQIFEVAHHRTTQIYQKKLIILIIIMPTVNYKK